MCLWRLAELANWSNMRKTDMRHWNNQYQSIAIAIAFGIRRILTSPANGKWQLCLFFIHQDWALSAAANMAIVRSFLIFCFAWNQNRIFSLIYWHIIIHDILSIVICSMCSHDNFLWTISWISTYIIHTDICILNESSHFPIILSNDHNIYW